MQALGRFSLAAVGPLLTIAAVIVVISLRPHVPITSPGVPLLLLVAVAAVLGGIPSGLASAAVMAGFIAVDASAPGALFTYAPESVSRLASNLVVAPTMAILVGGLSGRLRKQDSELTHARAHERDLALTEAATDGIITIDATSRIRSANPAAHELFGYADEQLVGRPLTDLIPEDQHAAHLAGLRSYVETGERHIDWRGTDLVGRHAGGRPIAVEVSFAAYGQGSDLRFIGIVRDVRRRRDLEEQLRQGQKMEALGQLAGGVAHDFNNILTAVYGFTDLARSDLRPDDPRSVQLGYVIDAAMRGRDLVAQLMAFGRRQVLSVELLDLGEMIASLEPMIRRLIGEHITVTIRLGAGTRPIEADGAQLSQVILNLAINARDAMPEGGELVIGTATVDLDSEFVAEHAGVEAGAYTVLTISDDGTGMDAATKARIFEPFFTTKAQGHGTGLGLATVHGIVAQTGGRITVYSEPGRGTTFRVYFPAREGDTSYPEAVEPPVPQGHQELILVAEDEDSIRELARVSLERSGYRVVAAMNAEEALDILASTAVEAILTDVVMPGRSGIELAALARHAVPGMPVIFMSGHAPGLVEQQGGMRQLDVYLAKPFTPRELARAVGQALALRQSHPDPVPPAG